MPQIASAKKRVRVTARQTVENSLHRTRARTALKQVRVLAGTGKVKEAVGLVAVTSSHLDKAAKVGAFHANTVSRYKSRLSAALKTAGNKDAIPAQGKAVTKKTTRSAKPKKTPVKPAPKAKKPTSSKAERKPIAKPKPKE